MEWLWKLLMVFMAIAILILGIGNYKSSKDIKTLTTTIDSLSMQIDTVYTIIDAQANHFKDCAFISRDDVGVGYQGYFYSKYYRKYKITNE